MRNSEISVIPCSAEIDLNGIPTIGILTKINCTSKTRKFRGNLTEILTEILTEMVPEISTEFTKLPEITRKFWKQPEIHTF